MRPTRGQVLFARGRPPQSAEAGKKGIITRTAVAIFKAGLLSDVRVKRHASSTVRPGVRLRPGVPVRQRPSKEDREL